MSHINLIHGDCLQEMSRIPSRSVDLILCDPPYGTTACKWDVIIPLDKMWDQLNRIIKDNGAILIFGCEPFSSHLRISNLKNYKYDWVWLKSRPVGWLNSKKMPLSSHEIISVFYKSPPSYFPQKWESKPMNTVKTRGGKKESGDTYGHREKVLSTEFNSTERFPLSYLKMDNITGNSSEKVNHPTQKPVQLMEYLINTYTIEGECVLDFTMGSGSTGVACKNLKRSFIGIENDENYFEICKQRMSI